MFRKLIPFKFAPFLLFVFIIMGGWANAAELSESKFFEESYEAEDSLGYSFENVKGFKEENDFFDSSFNELKITDSRTYTSSPRKRERLKDFQRGRLKDFQNKLELNYDYLQGMYSDLIYTATSPSRWDRKDWMTAGLVAGGTGLFIGLDEEIRMIN